MSLYTNFGYNELRVIRHFSPVPPCYVALSEFYCTSKLQTHPCKTYAPIMNATMKTFLLLLLLIYCHCILLLLYYISCSLVKHSPHPFSKHIRVKLHFSDYNIWRVWNWKTYIGVVLCIIALLTRLFMILLSYGHGWELFGKVFWKVVP